MFSRKYYEIVSKVYYEFGEQKSKHNFVQYDSRTCSRYIRSPEYCYTHTGGNIMIITHSIIHITTLGTTACERRLQLVYRVPRDISQRLTHPPLHFCL